MNGRELNALFIQPTRWCGLNCRSCYVKEHDGGEEDYHTDWKEQVELFRHFYFSKSGCHTNQISISLDNLHKDKNKASHMITFFNCVFRILLKRFKLDHTPEVHITAHNYSTLLEYSEFGIHPLIGGIKMISLSNINLDELNTIRQLHKTCHVNYNHMIPNNITSLNIDKYVTKMTTIGRTVSSIYLVIFKSPIGGERNNLVKLRDKSSMESDISVISTLMRRLPDDVRRKVHVDGCLQDTINHSRTGFGCSSNVSRVQVWPDGSVSGCPYAFRGTTPIGRTAKDILDNIEAVRKEYDFKERCHLPDVYSSISK